jgi:CysZ protein
MIADFIIGLGYYLKAFDKLFSQSYRKYIWYSGLISLISLTFLVLLIIGLRPFFTNLLNQLPWIGTYVNNNFSSWMISLVLFIGTLSIFKYVVLVVTAPLMSHLSEKVECDHFDYDIGATHSTAHIINGFTRGLRLSFRNLFRELVWTLLLLVISLIPVFTILSAPAAYLIQAFYAGFGNYDYSLERRYTYRETISYVKSNRAKVTANGAIFLLLLYIPILGVFIAPPLATIAATMHMLTKRASA